MYINSFFDTSFSVFPLLSRYLNKLPKKPIVMAPRGEFTKGALGLKKIKKILFIIFSKLIKLHKELVWQASSSFESDRIQHVTGADARRIFVVPDMPVSIKNNKDQIQSNHIDSAGTFKICFLSRICPIKNLEFCLRVINEINVPVIFDIYGPKEDEVYWSKCERILNDLSSTVTASYKGAIEHSQVMTVLSNYDLFFFPSCGENYGHVILESMLVGTPVLISDATPWKNLKNIGVGWDLSLNNKKAFVNAIEEAAAKSLEEYEEWRKHVSSYADEISNDDDVMQANKKLFLNSVDS